MNKHVQHWDQKSDLDDHSFEEFVTIDTENNPQEIFSAPKDSRSTADMVYKLRRKREKIFSPGLFSDPAWDILLDLYAAEGTQKGISITSSCLAAGVPASTGLRWITILIQNGYVERREDPADARRSLVNLTTKARDALEALFDEFDVSRR